MEFEFRADREAHLRMLCQEMGKSVDDFINKAVLTFMEDYEDAKEAEESRAESAASGEQNITIQQFMEKYGLEIGDFAEGGEADEQIRRVSAEEDPQLSPGKASKAA